MLQAIEEILLAMAEATDAPSGAEAHAPPAKGNTWGRYIAVSMPEEAERSEEVPRPVNYTRHTPFPPMLTGGEQDITSTCTVEMESLKYHNTANLMGRVGRHEGSVYWARFWTAGLTSPS